MTESERRQLRVLVDEARRGELEVLRRGKQTLKARQASEKEEVAASKVILAAHQAHDLVTGPLKVVAQRGRHCYLLSVGPGSARILDVRGHAPRLSDACNVHGLLARGRWTPFEGESLGLLAMATVLIH